jgi:hypothetical protein
MQREGGRETISEDAMYERGEERGEEVGIEEHEESEEGEEKEKGANLTG